MQTLKKLVNLFIFIHATSPVQNNHIGPNVHFVRFGLILRKSVV